MSLFLRRLVADHKCLHIRVDGMRRNAVRDGCFYGVQGDDPRDACDDAEGDDVGKERLADLFDGERRDGDGDDRTMSGCSTCG